MELDRVRSPAGAARIVRSENGPSAFPDQVASVPQPADSRFSPGPTRAEGVPRPNGRTKLLAGPSCGSPGPLEGPVGARYVRPILGVVELTLVHAPELTHKERRRRREDLVERGPSRYWQGFGENCWWPRPGWHFWVRRAESNRHLFPVRLNCSA